MNAATARALIERAKAARDDGDDSGSLALYEQASDVEDAAVRAQALRHVGDLAGKLGRRDAARAALIEAEALYRDSVDDSLSLANTLRLRAMLDGGEMRWREARNLYERAGAETGLDMTPAFAECDRHLAGGDASGHSH